MNTEINDKIFTGKCHCGSISYVADGLPKYHGLCHCIDCRRWSGAPMASWIAFKEKEVTITGKTVAYQSSLNATREFCGKCGTGLFYRNPVSIPGVIDIQSGTLDHLKNHPPEAHVMVKERLSWMDQAEDLPKFQTYPGAD